MLISFFNPSEIIPEFSHTWELNNCNNYYDYISLLLVISAIASLIFLFDFFHHCSLAKIVTLIVTISKRTKLHSRNIQKNQNPDSSKRYLFISIHHARVVRQLPFYKIIMVLLCWSTDRIIQLHEASIPGSLTSICTLLLILFQHFF